MITALSLSASVVLSPFVDEGYGWATPSSRTRGRCGAFRQLRAGDL
jgi:hypothetical protein